jgi:hypothetical protein
VGARENEKHSVFLIENAIQQYKAVCTIFNLPVLVAFPHSRAPVRNPLPMVVVEALDHPQDDP